MRPCSPFFFSFRSERQARLPKYLGLVAFAAIPALVTLASWTIASQHQLFPILDRWQPSLGDQMEGLCCGEFGRTHCITCGRWPERLQSVIEVTLPNLSEYWDGRIPICPAGLSLRTWLYFSQRGFRRLSEKRCLQTQKIIVGLVVIFVYSCIQTTQYCTYSPRPSTVFFGFLGQIFNPPGSGFFSPVP